MLDRDENQSPIDIGNSSGTSIASGNSIQLSIPDYPNGAKFENLGTNVEVIANGTLVDGAKTYALDSSISIRRASTALIMSSIPWRCTLSSKQQVR